MTAQTKTPADKAGQDGGAKNEQAQDAGMTTHEEDHAVRRPADKPTFDDAEGLIRAGLTLIPLHHRNAVDSKGRDRGKSPIDPAWQSRDYDSREVLAQAERRGLNVGVRLPPTWMVLDVDPRNFPEDRDPLAELAADVRLDLSLDHQERASAYILDALGPRSSPPVSPGEPHQPRTPWPRC